MDLATWPPTGDLATYGRPAVASGCQCWSTLASHVLATCWQPTGDLLATCQPGDLATTGNLLATYCVLATFTGNLVNQGSVKLLIGQPCEC